jgi:hypothetical protein
MKIAVKLRFPNQEGFEEAHIRIGLFEPVETFNLSADGEESETFGWYRGVYLSILNYEKIPKNQ